MTEIVNPTLGKIEDAIERFGLFALTQVGLNALFAAAPWLAWQPMQAIIRNLTEMLADKIFAGLRMVIDLKAIPFLNAQHKAAFEREILRLKVLARGYGIDSPEFKKQREDAKTNFANFVRYNGV